MLGLASCQQEPAVVNPVGGEVDFQLTVDALSISTRAGENGAADSNAAKDSAFGAIDYFQGANWNEVDLRYTLEVYDQADDCANAVPVKARMVQVVDEYAPVTFDLRLVPGRDYHFVVFADFVTEGVDENYNGEGLHHVIGNTLADITLKDDAINDESTDAYFAAVDFNISDSTPKSIVLRRPYGKLRVIATDMEELNLNLDPAKVVVSYYNVPYAAAFNALTGDITAATRDISFEKTLATDKTQHVYTVGYDALSTHMTLFTDYILAENEQHSVHFTMDVYDQNNVLIKSTNFDTEIPVQRNNLTTIIGNVLTTATEVNVTIDDNFENADRQYYVFEAFVNGGEVTLTEDYVIGRPLFVEADAVLNLNGHSITNAAVNAETDVIIVREGATLTINGEGTIEAVSGNDGYAIIVEGTVIINGGTFKAGVDANGEPNAVVYARGNGKVYVNGGLFPNENNSTFVLNKRDADRANTVIEVRGGRYYKFDPSNNLAENPQENFVAEGYLSLEVEEDWYEVISCLVVRNADEFTAAAANPNYLYIYIADDIDYGTSNVTMTTDKIVLGNGHRFTAGGNTSKNYGINVRNAKVVLNDLVMENCGGINVWNEGSQAVINNCNIKVKYSGSSRHLFYAAVGGEIVVNSGNFEITTTKSRYLCDDTDGRIYVRGGTFADMVSSGYSPVNGNGTVEITGGRFQVNVSNYKFDPTNWVPAATHKVERVGNYMEVSAR